MWHPLERIAENRKLDKTKLIEFARVFHNQYSIIDEESENPLISNWWVDDFVQHFKTFEGIEE